MQSSDGARIAYRVFGAGEPTVLVSNGIGCNQAFVDPVIQALAEHHRVVLWDYRAHVDSPVPADLGTTLVVAGEKDNFTPLSSLRRLRDGIPGAEYYEVPGASHAGLVEFPDEINARVVKFMTQHFG